MIAEGKELEARSDTNQKKDYGKRSLQTSKEMEVAKREQIKHSKEDFAAIREEAAETKSANSLLKVDLGECPEEILDIKQDMATKAKENEEHQNE